MVNDLIKSFPGEVLRLALLSTHYRQPLNWTESIIAQSKKTLDRYYRYLYEKRDIKINEKKPQINENTVLLALSDDLNSSLALAELSKILDNKEKKPADVVKSLLLDGGKILGILQESPSRWLGYEKNNKKIDISLIENLIQERIKARENKDFALADSIRLKLNNMGIEIEDSKSNTTWRKI